MALGDTPAQRQINYRDMFKYVVEQQLIDNIRFATNGGMAIGNDRFKAQIEELTGRRVKAKRAGRPPKIKPVE